MRQSIWSRAATAGAVSVLGTVSTALAFASVSGCGGASASDGAPPSPPPESSGDEQPYPSFDDAVALGRDCATSDVAVLDVEFISIAARGTRSQKMTLRAVVVASRYGRVAGRFDATHYVGGDVFMEEGRRYLAILCAPGQLVGWRRLGAGAPQDAVAAVDLGPGPSANGAGDGDGAAPPIRYLLEGAEVDARTFAEVFDRLVVDDQPLEAESVENPDGSYGGSGAIYVARDGALEYRFESVSVRAEDGAVSESRSLRRVH